MSNYNDDNRGRTSDRNRPWTWIAGLVALVAIVGGIYALSGHRESSTASNTAGSASTAQAPGATTTSTPGNTTR